MARYVDIHPENPQPRLVTQVVEALRTDELIAYPPDSGYALGAQLGNRDGRDRILRRADGCPSARPVAWGSVRGRG